MRRQPSKTLIGAFVVGAVALAVLGIAAFGSGRLVASPEAVLKGKQ